MKENKKPVKGNKNTEVIIGAAQVKLGKSLAELKQATEQFNKLAEFVETSTLEVVNLENQIAGLEQDLKNKTAQNLIEIENRFKSDEQRFVDEWQDKRGLTSIATSELNKLNADISNNAAKREADIAAAIEATRAEMTSKHENELKIKELEHEKKEADNIAVINQNQAQIKFLTEQVGFWKAALDAERNAGIERAKAASIGNINVTSPR